MSQPTGQPAIAAMAAQGATIPPPAAPPPPIPPLPPIHQQPPPNPMMLAFIRAQVRNHPRYQRHPAPACPVRRLVVYVLLSVCAILFVGFMVAMGLKKHKSAQ